MSKMTATAATKVIETVSVDAAIVLAVLVDAGHMTRSNATDARTGRIAWQTSAELRDAGLATEDKRDGVHITVRPTELGRNVTEALR